MKKYIRFCVVRIFIAKEESLRLTIKLESDVILMDEDTKTLPIGHLIKPDGPSEIRELNRLELVDTLQLQGMKFLNTL